MGRSLEEMTDEELMLECQKDVLAAFDLLFRRYEKRIYNFSEIMRRNICRHSYGYSRRTIYQQIWYLCRKD